MEKTKNNLSVFVILIFVFLSAVTVSCGDNKGKITSTEAVVTFVAGDVKVTYPGKSKAALHVNDVIVDGAVIETGSKSVATVQINKIGLVRVAENSVLNASQIFSPDKGTSLNLESGAVFSKIIKNKDIKYRVTTKTLVASVRGTEFLTVASDKGGKILVRNGVVAVSGSDLKKEEKITADTNALVDEAGSVKVVKQTRVENLVLEKYSLQPYIENVEKGDNSKINEKFREIEPKEIELQKKIEKTEMMELSPLDRLRKMGKPIVKLFVRDGSQLMGNIEKTTDKEIFLNTGESVITIPKGDIKRRIPVK